MTAVLQTNQNVLSGSDMSEEVSDFIGVDVDNLKLLSQNKFLQVKMMLNVL